MKGIISHFLLPDTQVKPDVNTDHLEWAGKYIAAKRPTVIVQIGDFNDCPALSSYDRGKRSAENRRVGDDYRAAEAALERLMAPWKKLRGYKPKLIFCEGNHEFREERYEEDHPEIDVVPRTRDLFKERGWKVYPFLQPVTVHGVTYCHYFCRNASGRVTGSKMGQPSARAQALREMTTTVAGHKQGLDTHVHEANGRRVRAIIAGSFYQHDESYLTPQGNSHWQGCLLLNDVRNGDFELCEVSLRYLRRIYG